MKKATKTDKLALAEKIDDLIHEELEAVNDVIEDKELDVYIKKTNEPNIKLMDESDDIGVGEVLVIGAALALRKLHSELHQEQVMAGDMSNTEIGGLDAMPLELKKVLIKELEKEIKKEEGKTKRRKK
jgi:hypothetical protein